MNGLYILLIVITAGVYTWLGYCWGRTNEKKRSLKELIIINREINELLGYVPEDRFQAGKTKEEWERLMELAH